jgi:O-methyltransferase involved in polyketide biosynthesis
MSEKVNVDLGSVQRTLLLPLWGRAVETQKKNPILIDQTALEIINNINFDFSTIAKNINPITQYAWIARSIHNDRTIKHFLSKFPKATIVNLGCGLDTIFERIDNGSILWYDLDLPDVINLRNQFIHETDRRKFIECSIFDESWFQQINYDNGVLFITTGVLYYFDEEQIKHFFNKIAEYFPNSEIFFDAATPLGVRVSNKKVIEASGLDDKSHLKWGIRSASELEEWNNKFEILEEYPMFKNVKKGLTFDKKLGTLISDLLKIMFMVHLRFNKQVSEP